MLQMFMNFDKNLALLKIQFRLYMSFFRVSYLSTQAILCYLFLSLSVGAAVNSGMKIEVFGLWEMELEY
jgi:hypothetical protein